MEELPPSVRETEALLTRKTVRVRFAEMIRLSWYSARETGFVVNEDGLNSLVEQPVVIGTPHSVDLQSDMLGYSNLMSFHTHVGNHQCEPLGVSIEDIALTSMENSTRPVVGIADTDTLIGDPYLGFAGRLLLLQRLPNKPLPFPILADIAEQSADQDYLWAADPHAYARGISTPGLLRACVVSFRAYPRRNETRFDTAILRSNWS